MGGRTKPRINCHSGRRVGDMWKVLNLKPWRDLYITGINNLTVTFGLTNMSLDLKLETGLIMAAWSLEQGDLNDHKSLVKALKQVDVVISATGKTSTDGSMQLLDQFKLIAAIKEAGNIKVLQSYSHEESCDPKWDLQRFHLPILVVYSVVLHWESVALYSSKWAHKFEYDLTMPFTNIRWIWVLEWIIYAWCL